MQLLLLLWSVRLALAADWPQFLGPAGNGVTEDIVRAQAWPKEGPTRVWQKKIGQGFSGPVVSEGRVILFHRREDLEIIDCLNTTNGAVVWSASCPTAYRDDFGFDEGPRATPSIRNGYVFTFGAEGRLTAWDFTNGLKRWDVDTKSRFGAKKGFFGIASSPLVVSNILVVAVGGSKGAAIVGFDISTGDVRWQTGDDDAGYASPFAAKLGNQSYGFVLTRSFMTILDPQTGKALVKHPWRPSMDASVTAASPLVIGSTVFLTASYGVGAAALRFDGEKLTQLWASDDALSSHYATPVHHRGFIYGFDGRQEQRCNLRCVDLQTGKVKWSEDRIGGGTLMVVGNDLLVLMEKGELIQAPATQAGFKPINRAQIIGFETRAYPALANGLFYARSKQELVCIDLRR